MCLTNVCARRQKTKFRDRIVQKKILPPLSARSAATKKKKESDCPKKKSYVSECPLRIVWHSKVTGDATGGRFAFTLASTAASAATCVSGAAFEMSPQVSHTVSYPPVKAHGLVSTVPADTWFSLDGCPSPLRSLRF